MGFQGATCSAGTRIGPRTHNGPGTRMRSTVMRPLNSRSSWHLYRASHPDRQWRSHRNLDWRHSHEPWRWHTRNGLPRWAHCPCGPLRCGATHLQSASVWSDLDQTQLDAVHADVVSNVLRLQPPARLRGRAKGT